MTEERITNASPADVEQWLKNGEVLLIDVREPDEYATARIPGALLYPLSTFDAKVLPRDGRRLVMQCAAGRRSLTAAQALLQAGHHHATHLAGGIKAWREAGKKVIP
jgi:rhodanese-related sulfurtransferase